MEAGIVFLSSSAVPWIGFGADLVMGIAVVYACALGSDERRHRFGALAVACLFTLCISGYKGLVPGEPLVSATAVLQMAR